MKQLPTIPDIALVRQQPETLERLLVVGSLKSIRFFRQIRNMVCPWLPKMQCHRPDFDNRHYNQVWPVIESWWARYDRMELKPDKDFGFPMSHLENYLVDRAHARLIPPDEAIACAELLRPELENLEFTPELYQGLVSCDAFHDWLSERVVAFEVKQMANKIPLRQATLDEMQAAVERAKASLAATKSNAVNLRDVLLGSRTMKRPIDTGIPVLNLALGGGIMAPFTHMIAGAQGSGKTALASNLLLEFAIRNNRTIHVTTEEPPSMMIMRMVSNLCNIDFQELLVPTAVKYDEHDNAVTENIPAWVWKDPARYNKLVELGDMLQNNIWIIDWSKGEGNSITQHLEAEVEKITSTGWDPNVLQIDWLGGAVCSVSEQSNDERNKINRQYQAATDHVVNHCKRFNRAGVVFAQCDTKLVKHTTKRVTKEMLSECKTMPRNCAVFIGMSAMKSEASNGRLDPIQYLNPDKARYGAGGMVEVRANLKYQRFESPSKGIGGGQLAPP